MVRDLRKRERGGHKGIGPTGLKTFLDLKLYRKLGSLLQGLPGPGSPPPRMLPLLLSPLTPAQVIQEAQQEAGLTTGSLGLTWASQSPLARMLAFLRHQLSFLPLPLFFPAPLGLRIH